MHTVGVFKEITTQEKRIAVTPETISKLIKAEMKIVIESGAGSGAYFSDEVLQNAGATIVPNANAVWQTANIILKTERPIPDHLQAAKENVVLIAPLYLTREPALLSTLCAKKITAFALDLLPRIARAQSMDILSSMSSLAGYKSVLLAADHLPKIFPMMTTAAGTILPAKVIVVGAGVAGLQAIATARRLGAVVIAFDTRPAAGEQIKSLGAEFVSMETSHENAQDAGGYAKEQSASFYQQEQDILHRYLKEADVVITTALIPNKRAPLLITAAMVKEMKPGAVIVDLAAEQLGNCELTVAGEIVIQDQVTIIGLTNLPSLLPVHASQLFAKNLMSFLNYVAPQFPPNSFDLQDDIIKNCLITENGNIIHPNFKNKE